LFTDTLGHIGYLDYVLSIKNNPKAGSSILTAHPVPAVNELNYTLETQGEPVTLSLYSLAGNEVFSQTSTASSGSIPVDGLTNGIYILKAQSANHQTTMKIVVQH
ncbi:MAG: T9SS type A sorting domain-containing protein, partial [Bacteroidia bacterium]